MLQNRPGLGVHGGEGYQQVFGGHELVAELLGEGLRGGQHTRQRSRDRGLRHRASGAGRLFGDGLGGLGINGGRIGADGGQQVANGVVGCQ